MFRSTLTVLGENWHHGKGDKLMATIELTIPAGKLDRVIHALCVAGGFEDETAANAKEALRNFIRRTVWRVETQDAEQAAAEAVIHDDDLTS